ncbi:MAG: GNAT family N-acetyltransferase [Candidatus Shapirobacteria bacterium]|jgi:ribosomal protein S18 acetylase RimI-like enzyme
MIRFLPISSVVKGDLGKIIFLSYQSLVESNPQKWSGEKVKWDKFDQEAFTNPNTIGICVLITWVDDKVIGFASYEPNIGEIGHNCILPEFRGRGYGKKQLAKVLKILKNRGLKKVIVTTSCHPFFNPARKNYESLGFKEIKRRKGGPDPEYDLIDYEKEV